LFEEGKRNWMRFEINKDFDFDINIKEQMESYLDDFKNNTEILFERREKYENKLNVKLNFRGIDGYFFHEIILQNFKIKPKCVIKDKVSFNDCRNHFIT
jgi:hypothetical protein